MPYQTGKNAYVAFKVEGTLGTKPAAGGASIFRAAPSAGLELKRASVMPTEYRSDGQTTQARLGSKSVDGAYSADLSAGTFDALFEALLRGTWLASFAITNATMTSVTTAGGNTIVAAAGSWITQGLRVGDIIQLSGFTDAGNNGRNLRVIGLTATVITTAETDLINNAAADSSFSVQVLKRLVQGNPPVGRSFTFEEYYQDIDGSQVFKGCRLSKVTLKFNADQTVQIEFGLVGQDEEVLTGASAPYFTTPTLTTTVPLIISDGKVRVNGVDAIDFTSLEITFDLSASTQPVIGTLLTPDIFTNPAKVSGTLTGLRQDFTRLNLLINETVFEIMVMCVEPTGAPAKCMAFWFGNVKAMGNQKSLGQDNALIETIPVNIGADATGSPRNLTMMQVSSSEP
jgi:hypothetical protein